MNFKKFANKKGLLVTTSFVFVVIIVAIASFSNAGIDPSYWGSDKFIQDMIFTVSLVVIGVVSGQAEGDNIYRNNDKGLFNTTYQKYNGSRTKIDGHIDKFSDWNYHLYQKEYYNKCVRFLTTDNGIKQAELILKLDRQDIKKLIEPQAFTIDGKERYINSLSEEQIKAVLYVLDGKLKVRFVNDGYFLNAYSKNNLKSMYEQASVQEKTKQKKFIFLMFYRILITVLSGMVLTALVVDMNNEQSTSQAFMKMLSRYFTLFTSVGWGIFIASDMIKDECVFLDYKATVLETFYLDVVVNKTYIAKSEEDKAYEKIKQILDKGDEIDGEREQRTN